MKKKRKRKQWNPKAWSYMDTKLFLLHAAGHLRRTIPYRIPQGREQRGRAADKIMTCYTMF